MLHVLGVSRAFHVAADSMRGRIQWQRVALLAFALASCVQGTACESPRDPQATYQDATLRDSAGIEIVENHSPQWIGTDFWTIDPQPVVAVGGHGSDATPGDSSFLAWNAIGLGRLSDGRVAVLSRGEHRLLLFEPSGKLSKSIGRAGEGPGEFRYPMHFQVLPGDTLVVWDHPIGPVWQFDTTGALLGSRHIDLGAAFASTLRAGDGKFEGVTLPLPDGSFIVKVPDRSREPPPVEQLFRPLCRITRIDAAYAPYSFGQWEQSEQMRIKFPPVYPQPLFPARLKIAEGGNPWSVYISNGDRNEIQEYSPTGALQRIVRRTTDPIAITDRERELAETFVANEVPGLPTDHLPPQDFHPPVNDLLVDSEGYLWVMDKVGQWSVFGRDGIWLGTLEIPLREVHWIEEDLVLGIAYDYDMGLKWVEGYRLNRRE